MPISLAYISSAAAGARLLVLAAGSLTFLGMMIWLIWMVVVIRRDILRHRNHHCLKCGYDLRFSKERCPECGNPFKLDETTPERRTSDV